MSRRPSLHGRKIFLTILLTVDWLYFEQVMNETYLQDGRMWLKNNKTAMVVIGIINLMFPYNNTPHTHTHLPTHFKIKSSWWNPFKKCAISNYNTNLYTDVIMTEGASQITSLTIVYSAVYSGWDQRKHQSPAVLAFVREIHRDRWNPRAKGQ